MSVWGFILSTPLCIFEHLHKELKESQSERWCSPVISWLGAGTWSECGVGFPGGGVLPGDSSGAWKGWEVAGVFRSNFRS